MIKIKLAEYRKSNQMTQTELAQQIGVSFQSISKWETGVSYPDIMMITLLADFFKISLDEMIGRDYPFKSTVRKDEPKFWCDKLTYLQKTRDDLWNDNYFEFLVKKVWKFDQPINIVDFGCGYGYLGLKLMPLLPEGSTYTGLDISEELIEEAKDIFSETSFKTKFIKCDVYNYTPYTQYDVTICQAFLRHLNKPEKVLHKMVNSTKKGGKVICIEIDRMSEEIGYFNSIIQYDPFVQLKIYEKIWKSEIKNGGRDYSIGIKIPSLLDKLGLINVEARINDRVLTTKDQERINNLMETRGWTHDQLEYSMVKLKVQLIEKGINHDDVEPFLMWYKENIDSLLDKSKENRVTFFRGLIISFGDRQ